MPEDRLFLAVHVENPADPTAQAFSVARGHYRSYKTVKGALEHGAYFNKQDKTHSIIEQDETGATAKLGNSIYVVVDVWDLLTGRIRERWSRLPTS